MRSPSEPLPHRDLWITGAATLLFFIAFGLSLPVLPLFVLGPLAGTQLAVGIAFGGYAAAAVLARPAIGWYGDRYGRRTLLSIGALTTAVGMVGHLAVRSVAALVLMRLVVGIGQAAVMVAGTTLAMDLAPPERRGASASYILVALQVGLGLGPVLGEQVLARGGFNAVWLLAAAGSALSGALALLVRERHLRRAGPRTWFHRQAAAAGVLMCLGALGFGGFMSFVPLYAPTIGVERVGVAFLLLSGTIAAVRLAFANLPDRIGPRRTAAIALSFVTTGLAGIAAAAVPLHFYLATVTLGVGSALLVPAMTLLAVQRTAVSERAGVVATFTISLDGAMALGPAMFGAIALWSDYSTAFAAAAGLAFLALVLLGRRF